MSDDEPDAPLKERHSHDAIVPPGSPPAPETKKTHHKHKHHDKTKHKQKHKQKEKREHEEHKDTEDNHDQDHYVEPSASSLECVCCVKKPKLPPGKLDKETGQITYTKRVWSRCCCCLFPTNRALEVMLMVFLVLNAVTCVSYTVPSFFAVAVAQNILAPTFLLISLIYVIVLLGIMTKAKLTEMPQHRFNVVMAMLGMGCVIFYISPLMANHGVASNLPKNLETSFPNYFSSQSTLPPSPQSQPFAFTDWLNNFKSFRGLTPNPPHSLANVTTLPFKTVVDKEVRDCTSMSREWDPQLFMQVYRPTNKFPVSPSPVIFHIHGGGWKVGDMSWTGWSFSYFLERGYTIVSSQYSFTCYGYTGQEMRDDLEDAYNFLATKEIEWDLDMSRVTAVGESAGGRTPYQGRLTPHLTCTDRRTLNCGRPYRTVID